MQTNLWELRATGPEERAVASVRGGKVGRETSGRAMGRGSQAEVIRVLIYWASVCTEHCGTDLPYARLISVSQ